LFWKKEREKGELTKPLNGRPRPVATSLNKTTSDANRRALARHDNDRGVTGMALGKDRPALHAGAHLHGPASVRARAAVLGDPVDFLEAVRVDDKGPVAGATADEVVACVSDDKSQVILPSKVDAGLDMLHFGCHDHVDAIMA
jgi:hypothetical protein